MKRKRPDYWELPELSYIKTDKSPEEICDAVMCKENVQAFLDSNVMVEIRNWFRHGVVLSLFVYDESIDFYEAERRVCKVCGFPVPKTNLSPEKQAEIEAYEKVREESEKEFFGL